jgi:hypothetical protein
VPSGAAARRERGPYAAPASITAVIKFLIAAIILYDRQLFSQQDLAKADAGTSMSRVRLRELIARFTIVLNDAPAGEYLAEFTVRDAVSGKIRHVLAALRNSLAIVGDADLPLMKRNSGLLSAACSL